MSKNYYIPRRRSVKVSLSCLSPHETKQQSGGGRFVIVTLDLCRSNVQHTVSHKHPSSIIPYFFTHIFGTLKKELSNFFVTLFPVATRTIWVAGNSILSPPPRNRVHKRTQLAYNNVAPPFHAEGETECFESIYQREGAP